VDFGGLPLDAASLGLGGGELGGGATLCGA